MNYFRGNLTRQDRVAPLPSKPSSEASAETDKEPSDNSTTTPAETSSGVTDERETRRFRTIQKQRRKPKDLANVSILVPKAKTDKSTQVAYDEIKAQTGWKPPCGRLRRRKKYLKVVSASNTNKNTSNNNNNNSDPVASPLPRQKNSVSGNATDVLRASPVTLRKASGSKSRSVMRENSLVFNPSHDISGIPDVSGIPERYCQAAQTDLPVSRRAQRDASDLSGDEEASVQAYDIRSFDNGEVDAVMGRQRREARVATSARPQKNDTTVIPGEVSGAVPAEEEEGQKDGEKEGEGVRISQSEPLRSRNTTSDYSGSESADSSSRRPPHTDRQQALKHHHHHDQHHDHDHDVSVDAALGKARFPYSRARSDPQFTRSHGFPQDPLGLDAASVAARERERCVVGLPPRPRVADNAANDHVMDWVQRMAERDDHEHPERQSTVDTLDSGIENEAPVYSSFVSGHRRIHRRPYPWSIDLDPSLVRANAAAASGLGQGNAGEGEMEGGRGL